LGDIFPPMQRAKYMGYFIGVWTIASLAGPAVGGFLTDGPGWRWCFYINVPVGVLASAFIWANLPSSRKGGRLREIDFLGAGLLTLATVTLLLAFVWAADEYGFNSPQLYACLGLAGIFAFAFVQQERRHPEAILP